MNRIKTHEVTAVVGLVVGGLLMLGIVTVGDQKDRLFGSAVKSVGLSSENLSTNTSGQKSTKTETASSDYKSGGSTSAPLDYCTTLIQLPHNTTAPDNTSLFTDENALIKCNQMSVPILPQSPTDDDVRRCAAGEIGSHQITISDGSVITIICSDDEGGSLGDESISGIVYRFFIYLVRRNVFTGDCTLSVDDPAGVLACADLATILTQLFYDFDLNRDGFLSTHELGRLMDYFGVDFGTRVLVYTYLIAELIDGKLSPLEIIEILQDLDVV